MNNLIRVTVWNEYRHELQDEDVRGVYPDGIHEAIANPLRNEGFEVRTATLDEADHGLTEDVLSSTDVLIWWGHKAHGEVRDDIVERVIQRVRQGMGLIVLHSGHYSKVFTRLMGTSCDLKWREDGDKERLWVVNPSHPITNGLNQYFELPQEETYGEHFDIPTPDELIFVSWFEGGEVFRSGCTYHRGNGNIFYFRPGHETFPTYYDENVQKVIANAIAWAKPSQGPTHTYGHVTPLEKH